MAGCPVDSVIWIITGICNLNCKHCYAYKWRGKPELPLDEKLRLVREFAECNIEYVNISGGEPIMHPHTRRILEELSNYGIETSIVTNGTLLTREWSRFLAKHNIFVFVSLDGPKHVHDLQRGRGTYERVVEGLSLLREEGAAFATIMAVSKLNWRYTREFVDLSVQLGSTRPILIPVMPFGKALENRIYIDAKEYWQAVLSAASRAKELGVKLQLWCSPFAYSALPPSLRDVVEISFCRTAPVIDIDPQGNVLLCDVMDIKLDNVVGKKLREVVERVENHPLVREIFAPKDLPPQCRECPYSWQCRGGCFARALFKYGSLNAGDPLCPLRSGLVAASKI